MVLPNITAALRTSFPNVLSFGRNRGLCKAKNPYTFGPAQVAFITGKAMRADRPPKPPPFDYRNRDYRWWHVFTDPMEERLDDNSKIVIVEGPPAVGKDKFARKLADELEMLYVPQPHFDDLFITPRGFDYRSLNKDLPVAVHYFDEKMFFADPHSENTTVMQHTYYRMRFHQYINALAHVFSTGQGVVLQRSPWSDIVFMKAMHNAGYVSKSGYDFYKTSLSASLHHLLKPHLVIYLDVPASVVKQRIEKRALPHEINSQVLTPKYLEDIENNYKNIHLPEISEHAHLLIYNWLEEGDIPSIVDDIEGLNFDGYSLGDSKMSDWSFPTPDMRRAARTVYTNDIEQLLDFTLPRRFDVPEMIVSSEDHAKLVKVTMELSEKNPSLKYAPGFDPSVDKGLLWKMRDDWRDYQRVSNPDKYSYKI